MIALLAQEREACREEVSFRAAAGRGYKPPRCGHALRAAAREPGEFFCFHFLKGATFFVPRRVMDLSGTAASREAAFLLRRPCEIFPTAFRLFCQRAGAFLPKRGRRISSAPSVNFSRREAPNLSAV